MIPGFVNYFGDSTRETPLNLALARVIIAGMLIWRFLWIDWFEIMEAPFVLFEEYAFVLPPHPIVLVAEQWLLVGTLLAFAVGYRLRLTTFLSAVLLGHQATILFLYKSHGPVTVLFLIVYVLVFLGIYHEADPLTVDGFRHAASDSIDTVVDRLKSPGDREYRFDGLKYSLLAIGIVYFGSGYDKFFPDFNYEWALPPNLSRIITYFNAQYDLPITLGVQLLDYPLLIGAMATLTLVAELGLLVAILSTRSVTLPIVLLLGMKVGTLLTVNIIFIDVFFVFAAFFAWDRIHERLASDRSVDVVFDDRCHFCARSLLPFRALDVNGTITFYSQTDVPDRYRGLDGVNFDEAMYAFVDGRAHEGYFAFRELLRQFGFLRPIVWLMDRRPVERVGVRVYRYVADNRSRHFTCAVETT